MARDTKGFLPMFLLLGAGLLFLGFKRPARFSLPLKGGRISSPFGNRTNPRTNKREFHNGIDVAIPSGTLLKAPGAAKVLRIYRTNIGGLQILLKHPDGRISGYAHLKSSRVDVGDKLDRNETFARSGSSGKVTGAHLHFSLRDKSGVYIDPENFISLS